MKIVFNAEKDIPECIERFKTEEKTKENILRRVFETYSKNTNPEEVLLKVTLLNAYYSTFLNNSRPNRSAETQQKKQTVDIETMADLIVGAKEFDALLAEETPEVAVDYLRGICREEYNDIYSFASKYCNWHFPEKYPIVDRYSKGVLYYLNRDETYRFCDPFKQSELSGYGFFCKVFRAFQQKYADGYSVKDTDAFLWEFGKERGLSIS